MDLALLSNCPGLLAIPTSQLLNGRHNIVFRIGCQNGSDHEKSCSVLLLWSVKAWEFLRVVAGHVALAIPVKWSTDRDGGGVKCAPRGTSSSVTYCHMLPLINKVALPFSSSTFNTERKLNISVHSNTERGEAREGGGRALF